MQDNRKEFTLKQMGEVFKRGWLTMLIYILIAAIVFGSVAAIYKTTSTTSEYRAKISFASAVDDDMLTDLNSSANVSKALTDLGMKEDEIPAYVDAIRSAISITPIVYSNQTDTETQFIPSSYWVTMGEISGLSEARCTQILNRIIANFIDEYNLKNSSSTVTSENEQAFADYSSFDYVEVIYEMNAKLDTMKFTAETLSARANGFVSSSRDITFAVFISRIESLQKQLTNYEEWIMNKGITKETNKLTASEYIAMRVRIAEQTASKYENIATKWKEAIDLIELNGSFSGTIDGQIINVDISSYIDFVNKYTEQVVPQYEEAAMVLEEWQSKQTTFDSATDFPNASDDDKKTYLASADADMEDLVTNTTQLIEIYNDMIKDYNKSGISSSSSASLITPAYVSSTSKISNTVILIIIALAVVLAGLIGFVQTRNRYLKLLDAEDQKAIALAEETLPEENKAENAEDDKSEKQ